MLGDAQVSSILGTSFFLTNMTKRGEIVESSSRAHGKGGWGEFCETNAFARYPPDGLQVSLRSVARSRDSALQEFSTVRLESIGTLVLQF